MCVEESVLLFLLLLGLGDWGWRDAKRLNGTICEPLHVCAARTAGKVYFCDSQLICSADERVRRWLATKRGGGLQKGTIKDGIYFPFVFRRAGGVVMVAVTFVANKHIEVTAHPIRLWLCYIHSRTRSSVLCLVIIVHYVTLEVSRQ